MEDCCNEEAAKNQAAAAELAKRRAAASRAEVTLLFSGLLWSRSLRVVGASFCGCCCWWWCGIVGLFCDRCRPVCVCARFQRTVVVVGSGPTTTSGACSLTCGAR